MILGSPRSGTSLASQIVTRWGAYPGKRDEYQPPDEKNVRGYFEWLPLVAFHVELFQSIPVSPLHCEFEAHLIERSMMDLWQGRVDALVRRMNASGRRWFWKYPQYVLALPFWTRVLPSVLYLVCVRSPTSVCASMSTMYVWPELERQLRTTRILLLLWQHHMNEILRVVEGRNPLFLQFERLLAEPAAEVDRLIAFLGPSPSWSQATVARANIGRCVEPTLSSTDPEVCAEGLSDQQVALWDVLQALSQDRTLAEGTRCFPLKEDERELVNAVLVLRRQSERVKESLSLQGSLRHVWQNGRRRLLTISPKMLLEALRRRRPC